MSNCIIAQSGGPTAAINASLVGAVSALYKSGKFEHIYGSVHGITGVMNDNFLDLSASIKEDPDFLEKIKLTPAMYLGSCRFRLPTLEDDADIYNKSIYEKIFRNFKKLDITAFFYIGGNDSMDTVDKLSKYAANHNIDVKVIGIPKTIDNDLMEIDHTPGFGSAAKYIANTVREIAYDTYIYDVDSVTIVEIMGRDAGWLTASSVLARNSFSVAPHLVYLPEVAFNEEAFIRDVKEALPKYRNLIIAVSEGIRRADGTYISATDAKEDKFGHAQLSGAGKTLEHLVSNKLGVKVRSIEINVLQRCAGHLTSATDIDEAYGLGEHAAKLAIEGKTGLMASLTRTSNAPYTIEYTGVEVRKVANEAKSIPAEFISPNGHDVTAACIEYLEPLIKGENAVPFTDGIIDYPSIAHLTKH